MLRNNWDANGGESEIRTHGGVAPTSVFETDTLNRSDISPLAEGEGFEPSHAGIKIRCLNQLGDPPKTTHYKYWFRQSGFEPLTSRMCIPTPPLLQTEKPGFEPGDLRAL
jgi:hypothetical protein